MEVIDWEKFYMPYEIAVSDLENKFNNFKYAYGRLSSHSPIESVTSRIKSINSLLEKAKRKGIQQKDIGVKIEDIAGIRIICKFVEDIYVVVQLLKSLENDDLKIIDERNYVDYNKESGYRSYHVHVRYKITTPYGHEYVVAEIQIRTMAMNFWATIEHSIRYKYKNEMPEELKQRLTSAAEAAFKLDKEMSEIREDILEVEQMAITKEKILAETLHNIEKLYLSHNLESAKEFNEQFFEIYEEGDINKLKVFNDKVKIVSQMYC